VKERRAAEKTRRRSKKGKRRRIRQKFSLRGEGKVVLDLLVELRYGERWGKEERKSERTSGKGNMLPAGAFRVVFLSDENEEKRSCVGRGESAVSRKDSQRGEKTPDLAHESIGVIDSSPVAEEKKGPLTGKKSQTHHQKKNDEEEDMKEICLKREKKDSTE